MKTYPIPVYVQRFFTERLINQLQASPNTIASYRDTFRLLLKYASDHLGRSPTDLMVADIDVDLVGEFLDFIEGTRKNATRSRNTRLSAIRSFFNYVATNEPQLLHHCQRILAIPSKRHEQRTIDYLTHQEIDALVAAPNPTTWFGRRDRTILMLALQTGLRVSELVSLKWADVSLEPCAYVRCMGKGRRERSTPIRKDCVLALRAWLAERGGGDTDPIFVSNRREQLSRDAVERIVRKHITAAKRTCPSLRNKRVTPHTLRHSAAMQLLQNGVDRAVIALWLGHASVDTTQIYMHADMKTKEKAMSRTKPVSVPEGRYKPDDDLLAFLEDL